MESDQDSTGARKEGLDMWYAGIDLHRRTAVVALLDDSGRRVRAKSFQCGEPGRIVEHLRRRRPFKAVIESSCYTRWLYDLLSAEGEVVMAHPLKLRAIWSGRAKTDELDAARLAELLWAEVIPEPYVPPERDQAARAGSGARRGGTGRHGDQS